MVSLTRLFYSLEDFRLDSGAEDIVRSAGLCQEGTARKMFGEKADYYQTLYAIQILNEAMWQLFYKAFEDWCLARDGVEWVDDLSPIVITLLDNKLDRDQLMEEIRSSHLKLEALHRKLDEFKDYLSNKPTAKFWLSFLEMCDILLITVHLLRERGELVWIFV